MMDKASPLARFWREFRENRIAVAALAVVVADRGRSPLLAPLITPQDPYDLAKLVLMDARRPPGLCRHAAATSTGSAPTRRAATCSRRSSTGCASRSRSASLAGAIAFVVGATLGATRGLSRRPHREPSSCASSTCSCPSRRSCWRWCCRRCSARASCSSSPRWSTAQYAYFARTAHGAAVGRARQGLCRGGAVDAAAGAHASCSATSCRTACRR